MLELIHNQKNNRKHVQLDVTGEDQSHLFINELMARIKYVHIEDVWNAEIKALMDLVHLQVFQTQPGLKAL